MVNGLDAIPLGPDARAVARHARGTKVLMLVPSPPPLGGVEMAYQMLMPHIAAEFGALSVCRSSVRSTNRSRGKLDWQGVTATIRMLGRLFKSLAATRPDVVLMTLSISPTGLLKEGAAVLLARLWRSQVVVHYHQGELLARVLATGPRWLRWWTLALVGQVRFVLVLGDNIGRELTAVGVDARKIRVLFNCIDLDRVVPKDWSGAPAHARLVFLGDVSFRKGFTDLVDAFDRLRRDHPDSVLLVAGEIVPPGAESFLKREHLTAPQQQRFDEAQTRIAAAVAAGVPAGIHYLGSLAGEAKWQLLRDADILVLPSYAEGLPMSVLEAMATGLAIVATRTGAMADAVVDGETGYLVDKGDVDGITDRLARLVADRSLRERMGLAGRQRIADAFAGPVVGRQFGAIMREAATPAGPRPARS